MSRYLGLTTLGIIVIIGVVFMALVWVQPLYFVNTEIDLNLPWQTRTHETNLQIVLRPMDVNLLDRPETIHAIP